MASPLLLELPRHIIHPPNHPNHIVSLYTSLLSLKRCLNVEAIANQQGYEGALTIEATCQAWTRLAETGMLILGAGLSGPSAPDWARGVSEDVERAISEGLKLSLAAKIPLRPYWIHLTALHAHLALWQHNVKFSRAILKRLRGSLTKSDPPSTHYSILLAWHANLLSPVPSPPPSSNSHPSSPSTLSPTDIQAALQITSDLHTLARSYTPIHATVLQLAIVLRLRTLVRAEMWHARSTDDPGAGYSVQALLPHCEAALALDFTDNQQQQQQVPPETAHLQMHALIIGVSYYTMVGNAKDSSVRLSRLHLLLDNQQTADGDNSAYLKFNLGQGQPPLIVQTTHPRVLFELAFLLSSLSKRDLVGRKPRRKLFAEEGLKISDAQNEEVFFPIWSSLSDVRDVEDRLAKIKADLLCEMGSISIIRSEFEEAGQFLNRVIAHTRTYTLFPLYAARITLHQAHLAHATAQHARAVQCYRAAAFLDSSSSSASSSSSSHVEGQGERGVPVPYGGRTGGFVRVAARAGEAGLLLGLRALQRHGGGGSNGASNANGKGKGPASHERDGDGEYAGAVALAREVVEECKYYPGTLAAVGKLLEAVLSSEIVKGKVRLKSALDTATAAQDNHLRALIIALTSAHYVHTASDHAKMMLDTARQLASGMGAPSTKSASSQSEAVGNAPLGLWVGEKFHELHLRKGDAASAQQQQTNILLREAVRALPSRYPQRQLQLHPPKAKLEPR